MPRSPSRPRSGIPTDNESSVSVLAKGFAGTLAGVELSVRQRPGGGQRSGLRYSPYSNWGRAAGDGAVLRQRLCDGRAALADLRSPQRGATLIHIAPDGTNPDTNPSRIRPRNPFDVAVGSGSVWKRDRYSLGGKLTVVNLVNKIALYDFLSSFSGTHFVTARTVQAEVTFHF
jgi:hypothetical protein